MLNYCQTHENIYNLELRKFMTDQKFLQNFILQNLVDLKPSS